MTKTVSDDEFARQIQADPINRALDDFMKAAGAGAVVLLAVGSDHSIRVMNFANGAICECQEPTLKMAHTLMQRVAQLAGGDHDAARSGSVESVSNSAPAGKPN